MTFRNGAAFGATILAALTSVAAPIIPAHDHLRASGASPAEQGRMLVNELNCVACHKSTPGEGQLAPKAAPDLRKAGARLTPQFIRTFLKNPQAVRPGTMMPALLHGLTSDQQDASADALTHYLVSLGGPIKPDQAGGSASDVEVGRELFHEIGCVACHAPEGNASEFPSVPLTHLAYKTTVDQMVAFLKDPAHTRPSGRMPDFRLSDDEALPLAVYLLRDQLDNPQSKGVASESGPGLKYRYFEGRFLGREADLEKAAPKSNGVAKNFDYKSLTTRIKSFAVLFEGKLRVDVPGTYMFYTSSDDSSLLWIGDKQVVSNLGKHPMQERSGTVELSVGSHAIKVVYVQDAGDHDLDVSWKPPQGVKSVIPSHRLSVPGRVPMLPLASRAFSVDTRKAASGKKLFSALRCVSCHTMPDLASSTKSPPPLLALGRKSDQGCMAESVPKGRPDFGLSAAQRETITAGLVSAKALSRPLSPVAQVDQGLAAFNCLACHTRDDIGGPSDRAAYFGMRIDAELGDEGRYPPTLTGVGNKIRPEALGEIVMYGKHHVRPYMATRMPSFKHADVERLIALLPAVDSRSGDTAAPEFTSASANDGRRLVGTSGFGCVNCHNLNGHASLGIPAVDLGTVSARLNPEWLSRFLLEPAAINKATRMPSFWPGGAVAFKDVADGTAAGQHAAIWNYLSLGAGMPLPTGMGEAVSDNELLPHDEPVVLRTFIKDAGPRGIAIGFPERIHVSFDANKVRLTNAWKGKFIDPHGAWSGRNMKFNGPMGHDVLAMPPGPSVAVLASPEVPWPTQDHAYRVVGRFKGYRFDKARVPILMYEQDGLRIEERPHPELRPGGAVLVRQFVVTGDAVKDGTYLLAAAGHAITKTEAGRWLVDGHLSVNITSPNMTPVVRTTGGGKELLVPLVLSAKRATIEVSLQW
jgi:mono/diheme cytochrome c family protein